MNRLAHALGMTAAEFRTKCIALPLLAVVAVFLLATAGCGGVSRSEAMERTEQQAYVVDERSGLCFAVLFWIGETRSVTYVPCTPQVLVLAGHDDVKPATSDGGAK